MRSYDVVIIGAGPAGCMAAGMLELAGKRVAIVERATFPRFTIGESFLPQNMLFFEQAGLLPAFEGDFAYKNGAQFLWGDQFSTIDFVEKFSAGPFETFQVRRDLFDHKMTSLLQERGVDIFFDSEVIDYDDEEVILKFKEGGVERSIKSKMLVDASGFARVLPRLMGSEIITESDNRQSFFSHIKTEKECSFDNNKILIVIDEQESSSWFWLIPLGGCRYSIGVTTSAQMKTDVDHTTTLRRFIQRNSFFNELLGNFEFIFEAKNVQSYSSHINCVNGKNYIVIGNSCEFIDPIFSSGVTVAGKSASLAAELIVKKLNGEDVDWSEGYHKPLMSGVKVFRTFIDSWYRGELQKIIYSTKTEERIRKMIVSILAGYVWDSENVFFNRSHERLNAIYRSL